MEDVTLKDAKGQLEELLEKAARGEDVRIVDAEFGTFKLQPVEPAKSAKHKRRRLGLLEGKIAPPPDDFFDPMTEDELKDWDGNGA